MKNETELLFDTTALIDIYRGRRTLQSHFEAILAGQERAFISTITEAELWRGLRVEELERHSLLIDQFVALPVDSDTARLAGTWMRRYESMGLGWMDALIAATAKSADLPVLTRDWNLSGVLAAEVSFELYSV